MNRKNLKKLRREVLSRDAYTCYLCGVRVSEKVWPDSPHLRHR